MIPELELVYSLVLYNYNLESKRGCENAKGPYHQLYKGSLSYYEQLSAQYMGKD